MNSLASNNKNRIILVDALRGFALLGIVLIHFAEHFDFFYPPLTNSLVSADTDEKLMEIVLFLISGKAYSIFAITFGFSFFIQINNKEKQGFDFRLMFAWRLIILLLIGLIHSLIYRGDILHIYAILGLPLILLYTVNTKALIFIAILFLIQIPILYPLVYSFIDPNYVYTPDWGGSWFADGEEIYANGSFMDVIKFNFWKSRYLVYAWTFYTGRSVQLFALFIFGLIIGRKKYFEDINSYKPQLKKLLILSTVLIAIFHFSLEFIHEYPLKELQKALFTTLIKTFSNLAYTIFIISTFSLLYISYSKSIIFSSLSIYGKMSLTNYITQAVFGVVFFFGFGFGMWKYMGTTWSIIFGLGFFFLQLLIGRYWMKKFYYGPFEWVWRALTYMNFNLKMKR